jgi:DNA-binding NtrC family response regulator
MRGMSSAVILTKNGFSRTTIGRHLESICSRCQTVELPDDVKTAEELEQTLPIEAPDYYVVSAWDDIEGLSRVLSFLRLQHPHVAVFLVCDDEKSIRERLFPRTLVDGFLDRSSPADRFLSSLQRQLEHHRSKEELWYLRRRDAKGSEIGSMVAGCSEMRAVMDKVMTICRHTVRSRAPTVLISGETGTGKGQLARAIHYNGTRRARTLVEVNCASLPKELIEAELFGCEKGAFTGAEASRPGLLEVADKGSIFLDEIGALRLDHQTKLLRFLDEHAVRRVGSATERRLDVQVIAATNRDLAAAVKLGEFREDLFYRLNTIEIHLPPLRRRGDDVIALARSFMEELCRSYGRPVKKLDEEAEKALLGYGWPGNIRELRNRIERIALLAGRDVIGPEALELPSSPAKIFSSRGKIKVEIPRDGISLDEIEQAVLDEALSMAGGNVSRAARLLGIGRSALRYRLKDKQSSN